MIKNNLVCLAEISKELIQCFQLFQYRHVALLDVDHGLYLAFECGRGVQVRFVVLFEVFCLHHLKTLYFLDVLLCFVGPLLDMRHVRFLLFSHLLLNVSFAFVKTEPDPVLSYQELLMNLSFNPSLETLVRADLLLIIVLVC